MSDLSNAPPAPHPPTAAEIRAWLDFEYASLVARRAELLAALQSFLADNAVIDDAEAAGRAAENKRMVTTLRTSAEAQRKLAKAPLMEATKALDAWFASALAPLEAPLAALVGRLNAYAEKVLAEETAKREATAQAAREKADREAAEAAAALAASRPGSDAARVAITKADIAEQDAAAAEQARAVRPAAVTQVRGEFGATASLRTVWRWREVNHALVPPQYTDVNKARVNAAFQAGGRHPDGRPRTVIPGIETYSERSV